MQGTINLGETQEFRYGEFVVRIQVDFLKRCPTWRWYEDGPGPIVVDLHHSADISPGLPTPSWVYERFSPTDEERNIKLYLPTDSTQLTVGREGHLSHPLLPERWLDFIITNNSIQWTSYI